MMLKKAKMKRGFRLSAETFCNFHLLTGLCSKESGGIVQPATLVRKLGNFREPGLQFRETATP